MAPERWIRVFVYGPMILAAVLMAWLKDYRAATWFPSLACNLFTTGLAILGINVIVAGAERRRTEAIERHRLVKRELRQTRRKETRRELVGSLTLYPAALCLGICDEVLLVAEHGTVADVLELVRRKESEYTRQAEWVKHLTLLYGRFLTFKELSHFDNIQRSVKALVLQSRMSLSEETHKLGVVSTLEQVKVSNLTLGMAFAFSQLLDMTSETNKRIGALRRKWDIPAIRKKAREAMAAMVEPVDPEVARLLRKDPEPDEDEQSPPNH